MESHANSQEEASPALAEVQSDLISDVSLGTAAAAADASLFDLSLSPLSSDSPQGEERTAVSAAPSPLLQPPPPRVLSEQHPKYAQLASTLATISSEARSELAEELRAKKVDVGAVRDLLRFHLARQIEVEAELQKIARQEEEEEGKHTNAQTDDNQHAAPPSTPTFPSLVLPSSLLQAHPLIPSDLRGQLWLLLLGCHNKDASLLDGFDLDQITRPPRGPSALRPEGVAELEQEEEEAADSLAEGVLTTQLRAAIQMDAQRTRNGMHGNAQLVQELETLLAFYCHSRGVGYKQGLSDVLAPILMCMSPATAAEGDDASSPAPPSLPSTSHPNRPSIPRGSIYNSLYAFISKYLPSIFMDAEFQSLRAIFRLFQLLLRYHAPELSAHFEAADIRPEVYATSWFLTLFSAQRGCDSLTTLHRFWDAVVTEDDPFLHYFMAVALLRSQKDFLLATPHKYLPVALRKLDIRGDCLHALLGEAKKLRQRTPTSFRQTLFEVSFAKGVSAAVPGTTPVAPPSSFLNTHTFEQLASYAELLPCLSVPAAEIVQQAYSDLDLDLTGKNESANGGGTESNNSSGGGGSGPIKFILLDCRSRAEYDAGHLPCAINLNPSILHIPSQLEALVSEKAYGGMRECHFCFIGAQMASFAEVATAAPAPPALAPSHRRHGSSGMHALNLPHWRRPVPPPSPSSSLAALAEAARAEEAKLLQEGGQSLLPPSVPLTNLNKVSTAVPSAESTEESETSVHTPSLTTPGTQGLAVQVGSPLSPPLSSPSPTASPSEGRVLYRPDDDEEDSRSAGVAATATVPSTSFIRQSPLLDTATSSFVQWFLSHNFSHVSVCEGGFPACHSLVLRQAAAYRAQKAALAAGTLKLPSSVHAPPLENMELVDHQPAKCQVCNPPALEETVDLAPPPVAAHTPPQSAIMQQAEETITPATPSIVKEGKASSMDANATPATPQVDTQPHASSSSPAPVKETHSVSPDVSSKESDKDNSESASVKAAKAMSKFSLGFKKFGATLSAKIDKFKEEREMEKEKERVQKEKEQKEKKEREQKEKEQKEKEQREKEQKEKEEKEKEQREKEEKEKAASSASAKPVPASEESGSAPSSSDSSKSTFSSRFMSALARLKKKIGDDDEDEHGADVQPSEANAAIDLGEWANDENISLFHCHQIALLPVRPTTVKAEANSTPATPDTPATPATSSKRQGLLLPRALAVTSGYIIVFQPQKPPPFDPAIAAMPTQKDKEKEQQPAADASGSSPSSAPTPAPFGLSYLKRKHRLVDLDRITSKKDRPNVVTFHFRADPTDTAPVAASGLHTTQQQTAPEQGQHTIQAASPSSATEPHTPSSSFHTTPHTPALSPAAGAIGAAQSTAATKPATTPTMFLVERPKECIALVREKYLQAKAAAAAAESNRQVEPPQSVQQGSATEAYSQIAAEPADKEPHQQDSQKEKTSPEQVEKEQPAAPSPVSSPAAVSSALSAAPSLAPSFVIGDDLDTLISPASSEPADSPATIPSVSPAAATGKPAEVSPAAASTSSAAATLPPTSDLLPTPSISSQSPPVMVSPLPSTDPFSPDSSDLLDL